MSFRVFEPGVDYILEDRPCIIKGQVRTNVPCWSRPWVVPGFLDNPKALVFTQPFDVTSARTLYVQPECGREFNLVLNPVRAAALYSSPPIVFKANWGFEVNIAAGCSNCPRWRDACADGTEPGVDPNPPGACRDGSTPVRVCEYLIDLNKDGSYIYEERETPSWCYQDTEADEACSGDVCTTTAENAVDDWRITVPWCWDQTNRLEGQTLIRRIVQPKDFGQTDRTAEKDRCYDSVLPPR